LSSLDLAIERRRTRFSWTKLDVQFHQPLLYGMSHKLFSSVCLQTLDGEGKGLNHLLQEGESAVCPLVGVEVNNFHSRAVVNGSVLIQRGSNLAHVHLHSLPWHLLLIPLLPFTQASARLQGLLPHLLEDLVDRGVSAVGGEQQQKTMERARLNFTDVSLK